VTTATRPLALLFGYDGTDFHGSQAQAGVRTVQGELERALTRVAPGSGRLAFAGRTDAGVHALGQVATGAIAWQRSPDALRDALIAVAPADIAVVKVWEAPPGFHARFSASGREYRYRVRVAAAPDALERRYIWWRRAALDGEAARAACERLVGTHAFGAFAGGGQSQALTAAQLTRTLRTCDWQTEEREPGQCRSGAPETLHTLRVIADGFLPQMVRNLTAAICQVAQGARPVEWIDALLAENDRRALGEAAPPQGLVFWRAYYDWADNGSARSVGED
jgi:tRNA pseudouridine38-40 synthase